MSLPGCLDPSSHVSRDSAHHVVADRNEIDDRSRGEGSTFTYESTYPLNLIRAPPTILNVSTARKRCRAIRRACPIEEALDVTPLM